MKTYIASLTINILLLSSAYAEGIKENLNICEYLVEIDFSSIKNDEYNNGYLIDDMFKFTHDKNITNDITKQLEYRFLGFFTGTSLEEGQVLISIGNGSRNGGKYVANFMRAFEDYLNYDGLKFTVQEEPVECQRVYCPGDCGGFLSQD